MTPFSVSFLLPAGPSSYGHGLQFPRSKSAGMEMGALQGTKQRVNKHDISIISFQGSKHIVKLLPFFQCRQLFCWKINQLIPRQYRNKFLVHQSILSRNVFDIQFQMDGKNWYVFAKGWNFYSAVQCRDQNSLCIPGRLARERDPFGSASGRVNKKSNNNYNHLIFLQKKSTFKVLIKVSWPMKNFSNFSTHPEYANLTFVPIRNLGDNFYVRLFFHLKNPLQKASPTLVGWLR